MKILVTGATGFIGNYVIAELLKRNQQLIASSSNPEKAAKADWFDRVQYIPSDLAVLEETTDYFKFFSEPARVIHLAWEGLPNYTSDFHEKINLPRHSKFLTNLVANGLKDLTVTGTCFEYGMQEGSLAEDLSSLPVTAYGRAKDLLYKELHRVQEHYSFKLKWARLFYMFGKGQNPNSLLSQLDLALAKEESVFNMSGGEQVRDFLPVEQVAKNIVDIALQEKVTGIINCCSGKPVTVKDFVLDYLKQQNRVLQLNLGYYPYADYEPMRFWGDIKKLNAITKPV